MPDNPFTATAVRCAIVGLGYTPTTDARCSEAIVLDAKTADGTPVIVRATDDPVQASRFRSVCAEFSDESVRVPAVLAEHPLGENVTIQVFEHLGGTLGARVDAGSIGRAMARFESAASPTHPDAVKFDPLPVRPGQEDATACALWATAAAGWETWCKHTAALGWTHGDWAADNLRWDNDQLHVWDLGNTGWGPLGWDVAASWLSARYDDNDLAGVADRLHAYVAAGGAIDIDTANVVLEPAVAAAAALRFYRLALRRPELRDEAAFRVVNVLDGHLHAWVPLPEVLRRNAQTAS